MNKRSAYNFYAILILLVALVATMLIGCMKVRQENEPAATTGAQSESLLGSEATGESESLPEGETTSAPTGDVQTGQAGAKETEPSLEIEVEVGAGTKEPVFVTDPAGDKPTQNTTPTNPKPTQGTTPTNPKPTQGQDTEVSKPPAGGGNGKPDKLLTYEEFLALSNQEQQAYFFLFEDPIDYAKWLQQAQKEYEENQGSIIVTGPIDLSTLPNGG